MIKNWIVLIAVIITSYLLGTSILNYLNGENVSITYIIGSVFLIMIIIEGLTWDMDFKVQKDEMGKKRVCILCNKFLFRISVENNLIHVTWPSERWVYDLVMEPYDTGGSCTLR